MDKKNRANMILPVLIFILFGAAFTGVVQDSITPSYVIIDQECFNDGIDNDGNGDLDFVEEEDCRFWPYSNGNGESFTPSGSYDINANYQPYYDLTVDYVRDFVGKQCGGNLAGCIGTNFQNEVQFYCFFSDNIMAYRFDLTFDKFFNVWHNTMINDGSFNTFNSVCKTIGQAPTVLPTIEYQASSPIDANAGGSGGGK
jgi:hypothetical protein